ncbi:hypothetical protein CCY99_08720 [Helicobacter sp. 16-1353]|uniref:hypothetical protein n=1 Tax=Helicobacter sp. 16-1353 TaxID=2004996 RepID=UPI000DCF2BAE|nr:hypothetical protein [Helicobacter sp. 16-1353]RAX51636.1 hypothetical protein CCY99_08720 [Helicobacter sp. 16-1353]
MKNLIFLVVIMLLISGCNNRDKFGFTSSDCGEVYTNCMNKCTQSNKSRAECLNNCDKSRAMCEAVKTKGCMQNCNKNYGKNTSSSEACKKSCIDNKGVSY